MLKHWQVTIEVHHLPGLALKANVPIDRSQARRKHRKLHLGHLVSFPETSRPTQLLGSSPFLATSRYTRATSGCQRLLSSGWSGIGVSGIGDPLTGRL